ncbi:MAG: mandelate racemase/muconate lactonizing enzyme family protein [Gammaproteobacteria bacterium]|jgi:galactonate dehydratase
MTTIQKARIFHVPTGSRKAVILELVTDDGIDGIGEAGIAYGAGGAAAAQMLREMIERFVLGRDASAINNIWHDIYDVSFWTRNGGAISYAALSAIEQALWDIKGKRLDVPVHELLGGRMRDRLEVYANGWWRGCDSADEYAAAAKSAADSGYPALKFYPLAMTSAETVVRHPARRAIDNSEIALVCDRVAAVREAVGPDVEIMLDFGGGLAADQVLRVCRRIETFDILFIEEPVDPGSIDAFARVAAGTSIALAAGERAYGRPGCERLLQTGAVSILQPDVCNTGGLLEARLMAGMAETQNVRVAPHNYGSTLATAAAVQFAAVIPNFMVLEYFPEYDREPDYRAVLQQPLEASVGDTGMAVPDGPGLGVQLDHDSVEPWQVACCEL